MVDTREMKQVRNFCYVAIEFRRVIRREFTWISRRNLGDGNLPHLYEDEAADRNVLYV